MANKPGAGRPTELTDFFYNKIIDNVQKGLRPETIANLSMVVPASLRLWLKRGEKESLEQKDTIYAKLFLNYHKKKAEKVLKYLEQIEMRLANWQALWNLVQSIARDDFGLDNYEYKELVEKYEKLLIAYTSLLEKNSFKGIKENADETQKMDSESN